MCTFRVIIYRTQRICHSRGLLGFGSFGAVPCLYSSSVVQKQEAVLSITTRGAALVFLVRPGLAYYYAIYGVVGIRGKSVARCSGGRKHKTLDRKNRFLPGYYSIIQRGVHITSPSRRAVCVFCSVRISATTRRNGHGLPVGPARVAFQGCT